MKYRHYPKRHGREIHNAPEWLFDRHAHQTLSSGKAAEYLGMPRDSLIRRTDEMGLTVLWTSERWRYYLISELEEVIKRRERLLTTKEVARMAKKNSP